MSYSFRRICSAIFFLGYCASLEAQAVQELPALLPKPRVVTYASGSFKPMVDEEFSSPTDSLAPEAEMLCQILGVKLSDRQIKSRIKMVVRDKLPFSESPEAYRIEVDGKGVTIEASTRHGFFDAAQTLRQLMGRGDTLPSVVIEDAPAFPFRGYMVDVGRNYQSIELLKQQIDAMSMLKLNLFHFHMTENVAWRLAIKKYPQLTAQEHMTRDHGLFYSEREIKELMEYCADRHILFLPEIDMPGHSEAFERAMGFSMQSEEGLKAVLEILEEVIDTYGFKYFHIGADEVKIINKEFVPSVQKYLESRGVTVIGWQPGGNFGTTVWRQLWSDEAGTKSEAQALARLDSRNLYLNHMDPLETVPLLFNAKILGKDVATDSTEKGAILCLWNDRRLRKGEDNLTHNAVYPGLMAFAEKVWRGGGKEGNYSGIDAHPKSLANFKDLEQRMFALRELLFNNYPFPYVRQADIEWSIFGPYNNGGDTSKDFDIERASNEELITLRPDTTLIGGTIILRHFWSPLVKGHYTDVDPGSTFYALRTIESETERDAYFWISMYHHSTSHHNPAPDAGTWNAVNGEIWVNGDLLPPPHWLHASQPGNLEVPLEDENYQIRHPYKVHLRKGTNTILIKAPIDKFEGPEWYIPRKWMFTFVEAPQEFI